MVSKRCGSELRNFLNDANSLILEIDIKGNIKFVNKFALKFFGFKYRELINKNVKDTILPQKESTGRDLTKMLRELINEPEKHTVNINENIKKNGQRVWISWSCTKLYDDNGEYKGLVEIGNEVTDYISILNHYKSILENMHDGFIFQELLVDDRGRPNDALILDVNPAFEQLTNVKRGNIVGKKYGDLFPDLIETDKNYLNTLYKVAYENQTRNFEQYSHFLKKYVKMKLYSPKKGYFVTIFEDITEQKSYEMQLKELGFITENTLNNITDIIRVVDKDYNVIFANKSAEDFFKLDLKVIYKTKCYKMAGNEEPCDDCPIQRVMKENKPHKRELYHEKFNKWLKVRTFPLRGEGDKITKVVEIVKDISDMKLTEIAEKHTGEKLKHIVENINGLVCEVDINGVFTYLSPQYETILGYKREELIGTYAKDILHPDDLKKSNEKYSDMVNKKSKSIDEWRFKHKKGYWIWLECVASVYENSHGELRSVVVSTDVSKRKQSEILLKESENNFRMIFNNVVDELYIHEIGGNFIKVNNVVCENLGYTKEELMKMCPQDIDAPEDAELVMKRSREIVKTGKFVFQATHISKDGRKIPVEISSRLINFRGKKCILSVGRDITERKKSQEELHKSRELYKTLVETIPYGIDENDTKGYITYANDGICKMLGYSKEEIIGMHVTDFRKDKISKKKAEEYVEKVYKDNVKPETYYDKLITKKGKEIDVQIEWDYLYGERGNKIGSINVISDITERKKQEEEKEKLISELEKTNKELNRLTKMKDEFLAIASHDLKTPFSNILLSTEILLASENLDDEEKTIVEIINKMANTQLNYVNSILDIALVQSGKFKLNINTKSIKELVEYSILNSNFIADNKSISVETIIEQDYKIDVDYEKIVQVLNNLLSNAIKFTPESKTILIKVHKNDKNFIEVHVIDHGIGIYKKDLENIFNQFYYEKSDGTQGEKGTGLGLSIAKSIIELHGGEIGVESTRGRGSDFWFTLPLSSRG